MKGGGREWEGGKEHKNAGVVAIIAIDCFQLIASAQVTRVSSRQAISVNGNHENQMNLSGNAPPTT